MFNFHNKPILAQYFLGPRKLSICIFTRIAHKGYMKLWRLTPLGLHEHVNFVYEPMSNNEVKSTLVQIF